MLGILPVLAMTAMAGPAMAQQTAPDGTFLGTVVVQAGRGGEAANNYTTEESANGKVVAPLQETPKSIKIITRREMQERGQTSLTDILRTTPGVTLGTGEGGNPAGVQPTIRGNSAANDIMVDGLRSGLRTEFEAFNIESIEITKGPGGTVSGTGSTGGTINLVSKTPIEGEDFNDSTLSFGTGEYKRGTLDMNRNVGSVGLRLNLMYQDAESLYGREGRTSDRWGIAPSVSYRFNDQSKVTAGLYYLKDEDLLDYGVPLSNANVPAQYRQGAGTADNPWLPVDVPTDSYYGMQNRDFHDAASNSAFVRLDHEFSPNLTWSTTLRSSRSSNAYVVSLPNGVAAGVTRDARSSDRAGEDLSFNSQLTGEAVVWGLKHSFAFGVDVSNSTVDTHQITVTAPPGFVGTTPYESPDPTTPWGGTIVRGNTTGSTEYKTRAIYVFDVIELAPKFDLNVGLRFDQYSADSWARNTTTQVVTTNENDSTFWNGNVGLVYKPFENATVYFSVGSSTNPAGEGNGVGAAASSTLDELDPERALSYELGTKWALFDERLFVNAAIYETTKDNARQTNEFGETANIGETRARGFELDIGGQITDRWGISAGYAYTDARIIDAGFTCAGTPAVCTPSTSNGSRVTGVPLHAFSLWTTYAVNDKLTVGGGASFIDKRPLNAAQTAVLPPQVRVDLMASYEISEATSIQLNANNIFDAQLYAGNRGNGWANTEPGRNVSLTLAHKF